jgi:anti-sigma regulatory factor (Ser/Thr protein kinase)
VGPAPYLAGGAPVQERMITSPAQKDEALQAVQQLGQRLGLSEEKLRRVEVCADELMMNAINDAPKAARASPGAMSHVWLRFGADGRTFVISVHDRFGSITRDAVAAHIGRVLEAGGPRPRPADSGSESGGAGLGLVLTFGSANQLVIQSLSGKFTEVTAAVHIAGTNKAALTRGSALHMYL